MYLQWFPGHMTKAVRMMEEEVKLCDCIIYVLDARAPFACLNKKLNNIFGEKPVVYVLNKSDLVENIKIKNTIDSFVKKGQKIVSITAIKESNSSVLYNVINNSLKEIKEKYEKKGVKKTLRVMVAGIPNTGKSTVINMLCGGKRAKTGDKAGVTKEKQWIKINDLELLDTPGTTPPSFDNQQNAEYLAFIGCLNDEIIDFIELSCDLISYLVKNYAGKLNEVYDIDETKTSYEIFLDIGLKRGCVKKGNEIDEERTANIIINDLRKCKIGKISFD